MVVLGGDDGMWRWRSIEAGEHGVQHPGDAQQALVNGDILAVIVIDERAHHEVQHCGDVQQMLVDGESLAVATVGV
jgi:hypothetical protein